MRRFFKNLPRKLAEPALSAFYFQPRSYLAGNFGEGGCTGQFCIRQPIDTRCPRRDGPDGVDQRIEAVKDFHPLAAQHGDLADAVAEPGREPGGFDIQKGERTRIQIVHRMYLSAFRMLMQQVLTQTYRGFTAACINFSTEATNKPEKRQSVFRYQCSILEIFG